MTAEQRFPDEPAPGARLDSSEQSPVIHFGGPDRPASALRDLLEAKIEAVPAGGSIGWLTYYFCDQRLAAALCRARQRGVSVRICLEGKPRRAAANNEVIRQLAHPEDGIGTGLCVSKHVLPLHLHTKLYCFSHPNPIALVGSFNPSGDQADTPELIADLGDQDLGHNLLVEMTDPRLVSKLFKRVAALHSRRGRFNGPRDVSDATVTSEGFEAVFFPLLDRSPLLPRLKALAPGSTLRIAASHVRDPFMTRTLAKMAGRGVDVTLLTGDTLRRTPRRRERQLLDAGAKVLRFRHPERLPMHSKFMLAEQSGERWANFGSYNLTLTSRWLNHEILMFTTDRGLWRDLDRRWDEILAGAKLGC